MSLIPSINDPTGTNHSIYDWVTSHKWEGETGGDTLAVVTAASSFPQAQPVLSLNDDVDTAPLADKNKIKVSTAFGFFEVEAVYQKDKDQLNPVFVYLDVPGFGPAVILKAQSVKLTKGKSGPGFKVDITSKDAKSAITGTIYFYWKEANLQREVVLDYDLKVPFIGETADVISLFPASIASPYDSPLPLTEAQKYESLIKTDEEVLRLSSVQAPQPSNFNDDDKADHALLLQFLDTFIVQSEIGPVIAVVSSPSPNKPYTISFNFLIFELTGTIDPSTLSVSATLYAKIPLSGRVKIASIKGSLITGVEADINVVLAKGHVRFYVQKNGSKHDLYVDGWVKVVLVPKFNFSHVKIVTLPF